jgi:hypothetical protein
MFVIVLSHDLDIKSGGLGSHVWICPKSDNHKHVIPSLHSWYQDYDLKQSQTCDSKPPLLISRSWLKTYSNMWFEASLVDI